jgi:hypothetical protein
MSNTLPQKIFISALISAAFSVPLVSQAANTALGARTSAQAPAASPSQGSNSSAQPGVNALLAADLEKSRIALKSSDFPLVITLTQKIAQVDPSIAINWYRMAIAANRSGNMSLADKALQTAKKMDPSLSFASSPARVEKLEADIGAGTASSDVPGLEKEVVDPGTAASVAVSTVAAKTVSAEMERIASKIDAIGSRFSQLEDTVKAPQGQVSLVRDSAPWAVGFTLLGIAAFSFIAYAMRKQFEKSRAEKIKTVATMPLDELVTLSRDTAFILIERLTTHGHRDTLLYKSLVQALITLEAENGKARLDVKKIVSDTALADTQKEFSPKHMVLSKDLAQSIHATAARSAFKSVQAA